MLDLLIIGRHLFFLLLVLTYPVLLPFVPEFNQSSFGKQQISHYLLVLPYNYVAREKWVQP
jgi:hypothetical protein